MLAYAVGCYASNDMFALCGDNSLECMKGAAAAGHLDRLQAKQNECVERDQQFYNEPLWTAAEAGQIAVLDFVISLRDVHFERGSLKSAMGLEAQLPDDATDRLRSRAQNNRTDNLTSHPGLVVKEHCAALERLAPPDTERVFQCWITVPLTLAAIKGGHMAVLDWLRLHQLLPILSGSITTLVFE